MSRLTRFGTAAALAACVACATAGHRPSEDFPLDPREGLPGPFPAEVASGWRALQEGDAARAAVDFERALVAGGGLAARAGLVEALVVEGALGRAREACREAMAGTAPNAAFLSACGEAFARGDEPVEAFDLYRRAAALPPARAALGARRDALRGPAVERLATAAREAAGRKEWSAAREAAARAAAVDPDAALPSALAGDVERAAGDSGAALSAYKEALARAPGDPDLLCNVAELGLELSDWESAIPALDALAAGDPAWERKAEDARLAFRVANWPDAERTAARAVRLTRGQAARLLWWMFPEVREAKVTSGRIASDVLDRRDSREVVRAVSLGLLDVDSDTHRARPDAGLTFAAAAKLYLRLAAVLGGAPPECLEEQNVDAVGAEQAVRLARSCGFLREDDAPPVSGAAFTRIVDRVRALAAGGRRVPGAAEPKAAEESR